MIPVLLKLKNFLSYRDPEPLDFSGFDVACLVGSNGQGKSALLDAMTWAMFGAARGCEGGQNQERLIHDAADAATVEFVFELQDTTYRIVRSRARAGRGELQFQVRTDAGWTNLAADSIRETDARIGSVLRMDYRTFTASAFLLQGRADDFLARMKPEERKDVFARLLDLGVYERLEEAARTRGREAEAGRKRLAARMEELREVADGLEEAEAAVRAADESSGEAAAELAAAEIELEARREELGRLERTQAVVAEQRASLVQLESVLERERAELDRKDAEIAAIDELLARTQEVDRASEELEELTAAERELRRVADERAALERRQAELAGVVEGEARELQGRVTARLDRVAAIDRELTEIRADLAKLAETDRQLEATAEVPALIEALREQIETLRSSDGALGAELARLESLGPELAERIGLLERGEGACPVCGGRLDASTRRTMIRDARSAAREAAAQLDATRARREVVRKEGKRLVEETKRLQRTEAESAELGRTAAALRARAEREPQLRDERDGLGLEARAGQEALDTGAFAAAARVELESVGARLDSAPYDPEAHEELLRRVEELRGFAELRGRIAEAAARRERAVEERGSLDGRIEAAVDDLAKRRVAVGELARVLEALPDVRRRMDEAKSVVGECRTRVEAAGSRRVEAATRLAGVRAAADEFETLRAGEHEAATVHRRYQRLTQAFGRGGIPDRIIENVLPELTHDANEVLGRLSDYDMGVQFTMDKLTKAGKVKETFDVLVHHDGGVRDFQMFSGGEAFRVAFAIRLGLSKLLVRRSGARLETLVVDEGFGTQDAAGRERLVEAIHVARREFRKVLVITHVDELKDAFPTQIRVTKDERDGSRAEIVPP